jgi:uncharacterized membrane protein YraQ (UPF0718 family)
MNSPANTLPAARPIRRSPGLVARIDGALAATAAVLVAVALLAPAQLADTLDFVAGSAMGIAPFLVMSIAAAAWLKAAGADRLIGRAFAANPRKAIVLAALLGALSPFCSCGVIPVIAALLASGVPLAPVMAFWVASPVMAPDMYLITAGALGFEFATAKALAAIGVGLAAGSATHLLRTLPAFADPLRRKACTACGNSALAGGPVAWAFWRQPGGTAGFAREASRNALFLGKWLLLAFVLESLMVAWLPAGLLAGWVGDNPLAIPVAALIGVPAYLNGYAAVPVVAGLIQGGMAPGAGLAFMVAGAMTSIPAAIAVYTLVKRRVFVWYVLIAVTLSIGSGYSYALWLAR